MTLQMVLDHLRAMRGTPIPYQRNGTRQMTTELAQKSDQMRSANVFVIREQFEEEIDFVAFRTEREGADRRDAIMTIPGRLDGRLTARREGATARGGKHEARFVFEDEMGISLFSFFFGCDGSGCRANRRSSFRRALELDAGLAGWSSLSVA